MISVTIGGNGLNLVISILLGDKEHSMECRHSGSSHAKFPSANIRWKISSLDFWDQDGNFPLMIYQRTNQSTRSINYLCWWNWRKFWRRIFVRRSPRVSYFCTTMFQLNGHLQPRRNWPTWASIFLYTHPILRIWPHQSTTCTLDWKTIEGKTFFVRRGVQCCPGHLVGSTNFWILFQWLSKLEQRAEKWIELRGKYVE